MKTRKEYMKECPKGAVDFVLNLFDDIDNEIIDIKNMALELSDRPNLVVFDMINELCEKFI